MLSILLKPLIGSKVQEIELPELRPDTELSLSHMESGCLFVLVNGQTALVIKAVESEIKTLIESNRISLDFEPIMRPEFPSVAAHINIGDGTSGLSRFEYLFNLESEEEREILRKLGEQEYLDILFYSSYIEHAKRTEISKDQKKELAAFLAQAWE